MLGATDRLYFQYKPEDLGLERLAAWQKLAFDRNPQARLMPENRLHMTVLHFGILAEVFRELREQNSVLTWEKYRDEVSDFIAQSEQTLPSVTTVEPVSFELFGPRSQVLAIRLEVNEEIKQAHKRIYEHLKQCLERCGVPYPVPFMQGSPSFRFAKTLHPHISLLRAARHKPNNSVKGEKLTLHVLPAQ